MTMMKADESGDGCDGGLILTVEEDQIAYSDILGTGLYRKHVRLVRGT